MAFMWVRIAKAAAETGYTEHAVRAKIADGTWPEGEVWIRAPDGRILISVEGYHKWVETAAASARRAGQRSKLRSPSKASAVASGSRSSPPPLI